MHARAVRIALTPRPGSGVRACVARRPQAEGFSSRKEKAEYLAAQSYSRKGSKVLFENGSAVRADGQILIPGNAADFKQWALDPNSSGDDQIILLVLVSIGARYAKERFDLDERVSGAIYTVIKALSVAWVSLYWLPEVAAKLGLDT